MKQRPADVLDLFLKEFGNPPQHAIENSRDSLLERFASTEICVEEFVDTRMSSVTGRPLRFVWAAGIALTAVLLSVLVWSQRPPFSVVPNTAKDHDRSMSTTLTEQAREILPITVPQDAFEVASVKLLAPSSEAARNAKRFEEFQFALTGCSSGSGGTVRIDPGRLSISATTVSSLVIAAYGKDCTLVEGGPAWARSGEYYEITAVLPTGTPRYTAQDLQDGNAPELERMLQNLLADRFRLVLRRELREMSAYVLTVGSPGKMTLSPDETRPLPASFPVFGAPLLRRGQLLRVVSQSKPRESGLSSNEVQMAGHAISMATLAKNLRQHAGRIIVDKTGLTEVFDFDLKFAQDDVPPIPPPPGLAPPAPAPQSVPPVPPLPAPSLRTALETQLGLKLESARMPIEVLVIESVERPSEN
ncbi:MAG TPA: TIGR03435 family protein [Terriglobia bacterium]|nr:TIGR03435 family protein [Terriglobia bacterium]